MEEAREEVGFEIGIEKQTQELKIEEQEQEQAGDDNVLQFLDSVDSYLTLLDSLSSTLRQVNKLSRNLLFIRLQLAQS